MVNEFRKIKATKHNFLLAREKTASTSRTSSLQLWEVAVLAPPQLDMISLAAWHSPQIIAYLHQLACEGDFKQEPWWSVNKPMTE